MPFLRPAFQGNYSLSPVYKESELISLLSMEYVCDRTNTFIRLSKKENSTFPDIRLYDSYGKHKKCLADVKDRIKEFIHRDESFLSARDLRGTAPLHLICSLHSPGQMKILKLLCTQRCSDVNILDSLSRTPLHHSLSPQNLKYHSECEDGGESLIDIVSLLIENGADVDALDCCNLTPIHLALDYYKTGCASNLYELPELLKTLLSASKDTLLPAPTSLTPLHLACRLSGSRSYSVLKMLINPESINAQDDQSRTPLHQMIESAILWDKTKNRVIVPGGLNELGCECFLDKVELLLDNEANVNVADSEGMTPLFLALKLFNYSFCVPLVKLLLANGANVDIQESIYNATPVHSACSYFDNKLFELIPLFLKAGGDLNVVDDRLSTPLHYALRNPCCSPEMLDNLIEAGADVNIVDREENGPITLVCTSRHFYFRDIVSFLVDKGCDINQTNIHGATPLLVLLQNSYDKDAVETLVLLGADCDVQNNEGIAPLHMISRSLEFHEDVDLIADIMLKANCCVNLQDCTGCTPLHYAVRDKSTANLRAIHKLLLAKANPNIKNLLGMTPLHVVCSQGDCQKAKMLLDFGADVNSTDSEFNTPLHVALAARENAVNTIRVLIDYGADIGVRNSKTLTPFSLMTLDTFCCIISHTILLIATGKYSLDRNEDFVLTERPDFVTRYNGCYSCVHAMKSHFLGHSSITLLQFLLLPNRKAARYVRNSAISGELKTIIMNHKYRWYSSMIEYKLKESERINKLLNCTSLSLSVAVSPTHFPDNVLEKIILLLHEEDMKALNKAI